MSDYCTLADVKNALNLQGQTYADEDITRAITAASRAIDAICNRRFYPDADALQVRRYRPVNSGYCLVDDICEFTSLVAQESTWVLDQDFYLEPVNADADGRPWTGIRTIARPFLFTLADMPTGWAAFDGRVQVTAKFGWLAPPAEIIQATVLYASRLLVRTRQAPLGIVSAGMDSPAVRLSRTDPDVAALIGPYTLTFIA